MSTKSPSRPWLAAAFVMLASTRVFAAASLVPEHQYNLGACLDGSACQWDCGGAQCELALSAPLCSSDAECNGATCKAGPICDDGTNRTACQLPLIETFPARLVVRVDENDELCAPQGTGCNQTSGDDCGSRVIVGVRGRNPNGSGEFVAGKNLNLCSTGAPVCSNARDCDQCLDGFTDQFDCPRTDPTLLCNGNGVEDIEEQYLEQGSNLENWLNTAQPLEFLRDSLPPNLQKGALTTLSAAQSSFGRFCTGTDPRQSCSDDADCGAGKSCYAEAEYCVTMGLVRGRCVGGGDAGKLCALDSECASGSCEIAGAADVSALATNNPNVAVSPLGTCEAPCVPSANTLCLLNGRFSAKLRWNDGSGFKDALVAQPKTDGSTSAAGLFVFYPQDLSNWEILVKMIDGCGTNGNFWTLVSASTGFGWELTVRDEVAGVTKTFQHPLDGKASGVSDFESFATCGS